MPGRLRRAFGAVGLCGLSAAAGAASTTTLSGTLDLYGEYARVPGRHVALVDHDGLNSSRLAIRHAEDLADARLLVYVEFPVVAAGNVPAGAPQPRIFYLGLEGTAGKWTLGRQYTPHYRTLSRLDGFGVKFWGNAYAIFRGAAKYQTDRSALAYESPLLPAGVRIAALYSPSSPAHAADAVDGGRAQASVALSPTPALFIGAAYVVDHRYAHADPEARLALVGAGYDFGVARLSAGVQYLTLSRSLTHVLEATGGGCLHLSPELDLLVDYSRTRDLGNGQARAATYGVGLVFSLSRRTALYASLAWLRNGQDSGSGFVLPVADGQPSADVLAGLRLNF